MPGGEAVLGAPGAAGKDGAAGGAELLGGGGEPGADDAGGDCPALSLLDREPASGGGLALPRASISAVADDAPGLAGAGASASASAGAASAFGTGAASAA